MSLVIEITGAPLEELAESIEQGAMVDAHGRRMLTEKTVGKINGLKVEVFSNEHPPPHFRVIYQGQSSNYSIKDCEKLNGDLSKYHNNIVVWHRANKEKLIAAWNETRPTDCPVGKYVEDHNWK